MSALGRILMTARSSSGSPRPASRVQDEMEGAHDEVRDAEYDAIDIEGVRRGQ